MSKSSLLLSFKKEDSFFFFEKKKQKTFTCWARHIAMTFVAGTGR